MADHKYRDASYLGDPADDTEEPEVHDLGFIVDDRDDRRIRTVDGSWERLEELDTDEGIGVNKAAPVPLEEGDGLPPPEAFASLYNLSHVEAEQQEEDFVETSMLPVDPMGGAGSDDFTSSADLDDDGRLETTDIEGQVPGVARGFGTSVPMDIGAGGFQIRDNPLMRSQDPDQPISDEAVSDEALGLRDVDEMGEEEDLDRLADLGAGEEERRRRKRR
jgi:hypothetical protein